MSRFGLNFGLIKSNKGVIPLVSIFCLAVTGAASFVGYSLVSKNDVCLAKQLKVFNDGQMESLPVRKIFPTEVLNP